MRNYELRLKNCESKLERRNQPNEVEEIERLKR
jgi:hypothetical protein